MEEDEEVVGVCLGVAICLVAGAGAEAGGALVLEEEVEEEVAEGTS